MTTTQVAVKGLLTGCKATAYVSPRLTVKITPRCKTARAAEYVITIGKPNFAERKLIRDYIKAGEPFPVKKIQLKGGWHG